MMNRAIQLAQGATPWRRKPSAIAGALLLLVAFTLILAAVAPRAFGIGRFMSAFGPARVGADLMAMLSARSPGARATGQLADTKARKVAAAAPHERALAKVRPPEALPETFVKPLFAPQLPVEAQAILPSLFPIAAAPLLTPVGASVPPVLGFVPPPGGGGVPTPPGITPPGITPTPTTTVTPPAVPEPGSWALMLMGFSVAGAALRRRRPRTARRDVSSRAAESR
ncbi:MAG: PEPxxWA-CTERM sorting domain-containing protein [Sphingomicrobium sp.]|nr:PEPxxWA-CTERM sorting domain-containing protein [Sphingomonadales bacterium]